MAGRARAGDAGAATIAGVCGAATAGDADAAGASGAPSQATKQRRGDATQGRTGDAHQRGRGKFCRSLWRHSGRRRRSCHRTHRSCHRTHRCGCCHHLISSSSSSTRVRYHLHSSGGHNSKCHRNIGTGRWRRYHGRHNRGCRIPIIRTSKNGSGRRLWRRRHYRRRFETRCSGGHRRGSRRGLITLLLPVSGGSCCWHCNTHGQHALCAIESSATSARTHQGRPSRRHGRVGRNGHRIGICILPMVTIGISIL